MELTAVNRSCSSMQEVLVGIAAGVSKMGGVGAAVEGLAAKLDANSGDLAAVQSTCKQLLEAVESLQAASGRSNVSRPCINANTQTESPVSIAAAASEEELKDSSMAAPCQPHLKANVAHVQAATTAAAGPTPEPEQPRRQGGRLTAYFRGKRSLPPTPKDTLHAQQDRPPAEPQGLEEGPAQHTSGSTSGKRVHMAAAKEPSQKSARATADDSPRWRRKGRAGRRDSGFDSPEQAPLPAEPAAAAAKPRPGAAAAAAAPRKRANKAAQQADKEQQAPPEPRPMQQPAAKPATSSLRLVLQPPNTLNATADAPAIWQQAPSCGSVSSRTRGAALGKKAAAAAAPQAKTGSRLQVGGARRSGRPETQPQQGRSAAAADVADDDPFAALFSRAADTGKVGSGGSGGSCDAVAAPMDQMQIEREVKLRMQQMRKSRAKRVRE